MIPVLERPGVGSISATTSARDPVVIVLVRLYLYSLIVISYQYYI